MLRKMEVSSICETSFIPKIKDYLENETKSFPNFVEFLQETFLVAAERGLNDDEFSTLLNLFLDESLSSARKKKLLPNLVPCVKVPSEGMREFMCWFIYKYRNMNTQLAVDIVQWIIGLVDNNLVDTQDIDIFYYDFLRMIDYSHLVKYACKLICKFTKPQDVKGASVRRVMSKLENSHSNEKFILAVLSLFKGYKPNLAMGNVKTVDVNSVLKNIPNKMGPLFQLRVKKQSVMLNEPGFTNSQRIILHNVQEGSHKLSSLIPFPSYMAEGLDQAITCYPRSIEKVLKKFKSVPIPKNVLSLLRDQVGFFIIMHQDVEFQERFSRLLLTTLNEALINQVLEVSEDDKTYLLNQTYQLELSMQQAVPCVSIFLAGFFLNWDGLCYRTQILNLMQWATFNTITEMSANILRPLYLLFVTNNVSMRQEILRAVTNLIKNMMMTDLFRVNQRIPYPFMDQAPEWTKVPKPLMLTPLIMWAEQLIKVGLCITPNNSNFLSQAIYFYEMMNMLEVDSPVPMWTVVSDGVVYHSSLNLMPIQLNRICRLLLRYHKYFLPKLRLNHPQFYNECTEKINKTSKYAQELMNLLWIGQAMTRKEDGILFKKIPESTLEALPPQLVNLDKSFDLAHNINFLPYIIRERQNNGPQFCQKMEDFFALVEFYLEDIAEFITHFSPSNPKPNAMDVS